MRRDGTAEKLGNVESSIVGETKRSSKPQETACCYAFPVIVLSADASPGAVSQG
ncbi:MAG TPA: hypothetical protein VM709_04935 [Candidatus Sulfotelmatobacter sp.]|nr:hypothetical protein [Candidatus Sulfotelmatobacter sp.]